MEHNSNADFVYFQLLPTNYIELLVCQLEQSKDEVHTMNITISVLIMSKKVRNLCGHNLFKQDMFQKGL